MNNISTKQNPHQWVLVYYFFSYKFFSYSESRSAVVQIAKSFRGRQLDKAGVNCQAKWSLILPACQSFKLSSVKLLNYISFLYYAFTEIFLKLELNSFELFSLTKAARLG